MKEYLIALVIFANGLTGVKQDLDAEKAKEKIQYLQATCKEVLRVDTVEIAVIDSVPFPVEKKIPYPFPVQVKLTGQDSDRIADERYPAAYDRHMNKWKDEHAKDSVDFHIKDSKGRIVK